MKKITLPLFTALILLVSSCADPSSKESANQKAFESYITGFTSGIIQSASPVVINLRKRIPDTFVEGEISDVVFKFSPSISGKTFLIDPFTVEFRPDDPLPNGKSYEAKFNLGRFFDVKKSLETFHFSFSVIEQDFTVYKGRLENTADIADNLKRYEGKMLTADRMSLEDARKILSVESPVGKPEVKLIEDGLQEFTYLIDSIPRKEEAYYVVLKWNGALVDVFKSGSIEIEVPSIYDFKLLSVNVDQEAEDQSIRLVFSDPLDDDQSLEGLIGLKSDAEIKLSRSKNAVTIYPQTRLNGEQRVIVERAVRSWRGQELDRRKEIFVAMEALKPEVQIIGQGVIMPDSRDLILPFKAVSLRAVDVVVYKIFTENIREFFQFNRYNGDNNINYVGRPVFRKLVRLDQNPELDLSQWNAFSVDLTKMVQKEPHAMYRVKFVFRKEYTAYDCQFDLQPELGRFEDQELYSEAEAEFWNGNRRYWYDYPEGYRWRDRENPCTNSYYTSDRFPERNLLASNIGLVAKSADNRNFSVAVTDLLTTAPVPNATLEFYDLQKQMIGSTTTGAGGFGQINLSNVPYLLLAKKGDQRSWLRLDDGTSLSVSNFDVSGQEVQEGIKGMIYSERDVWRPGDTLFLTFVMDDRNKQLPDDHPVVFELYNARGQMVEREVKTSGINGFYVFKPATGPEAPTGNWSVQVKVGGANFSKRLKVETIKPNRIKINLSFNRDILVKNAPAQRANLKASWLHGAPASGLEARVQVRMQNTNYTFEGYEKYTFYDHTKNFWPNEYTLFDNNLDQNGEASFPLDLKVNHSAPGMLRAVFNTRVFEKGGAFSKDVFSVPFAPYNYFVGINVPDGGDYRNKLQTDTNHMVKVVTVDVDGKPVSVDGLMARIYRLDWRWWWGGGPDNMAKWLRSEDTELVMQKQFSTNNGTSNLQFKIEYPDWGRYFIHITSPDNGHSTGIPVWVDWPSYISRGDRINPAGATILNFSSDKEKYAPGETATISFPSTEGSRALVSVESGSEILNQWWIESSEKNTEFSFGITPEMTPNIYVYLILIQPHAQTANDLPIRMYGVIPLMVEDPHTVLLPQINAPDEIRPQSDYTLEVSEKNGRPMTYTLAVVDEGLLDLTRFATPDPWRHFYAREALGIKTWDLFDEVLGAYGGRLQKVLAIGGDQEALKKEDKKAYRFKPVVSFLGPFTLEKNKTATHELLMPNYIGSVRAMVVAGHESAWGSAQEEIPVRQPLMVLPTAPRVIGPEEEFDLPVAVFAMKDNIKNVEVRVSVESPLMLTGEKAKQIVFEKPGEQMAYFRLAVKKREGVGKIRVEASSGGESSFAEIEIQVRNPNPVTTNTETTIIRPGERKEIPYAFHGMQGTNEGTFEVSNLPSFELEKNLRYLMRYPYGCLEQVTSSVFPQLYLGSVLDMTEREQEYMSKNIRFAIRKISRYQQRDGGFSYWLGQTYNSEWSTTYAGHFLLAAEEKGYLVPYEMKKKWISYQNDRANQFQPSSNTRFEGSSLLQAYRLYSLAYAGQPNMSAMNRLREFRSISIAARWRLAAAYLLVGMPDAANDLVKNTGFENIQTYKTPGNTFGSQLRDQAMVLEVLVMMDRREEAFELLSSMALQAKNTYLSTQTAAFMLVAYGKFLGDQDREKQISFNYELYGKSEAITSQVPVYQINLKEAQGEGIFTIENTGVSELYLTKTISGQPVFGFEEDASKNLMIDVKYIGIEGAGIDVASIPQGYDFEAVVTVSNPGLMGSYQNLALSQIFPSGWEIRNRRVNDQQSLRKEFRYEYRDIRDDRVFTFFNLGAGGPATFRISLNAAYTGRFYLPATSCEAMYRGNIYARKKGRWVEVVK